MVCVKSGSQYVQLGSVCFFCFFLMWYSSQCVLKGFMDQTTIITIMSLYLRSLLRFTTRFTKVLNYTKLFHLFFSFCLPEGTIIYLWCFITYMFICVIFIVKYLCHIQSHVNQSINHSTLMFYLPTHSITSWPLAASLPSRWSWPSRSASRTTTAPRASSSRPSSSCRDSARCCRRR